MIKKIRLILLVLLTACIGQDIDPSQPDLQIMNAVSQIETESMHQFTYSFSVAFEMEPESISWTSSNPSILAVDQTGLAFSGTQSGTATISATAHMDDFEVTDQVSVEVTEVITEPTDKEGTIATTSSYTLTGDFTLTENGNQLLLDFAANYEADSSLPGLYVYLSNSTTSSANALEIGPVTVFSGEHSYDISGAGLNDYQYVLYFCKPFNVKVGHGEITDAQ